MAILVNGVRIAVAAGRIAAQSYSDPVGLTLTVKDTVVVQPQGTDLWRLETLVSQLCQPLPHGHSITFRLGSVPFFKPAGLVALAAKINQITGATGKSPLLDVKDLSGDTQCYLSRIDFFKTIGYEYREQFQRWNPDRRFVPMSPLVSPETYSDIAESLSDLVCNRCCVSDQETRDAIYISMNELSSNIFDHAETNNPGIICAQAYGLGQGMTGRIEVALADTGIGLRGSLLKGRDTRAKIESGESPALLATTFGVTSKDTLHSGYGLYLVKELVRRNGGTFKLLSGNESVTFSVSRQTRVTYPVPWTGTIIAFTLLLDGPVDIRPVYDEIGQRLGEV